MHWFNKFRAALGHHYITVMCSSAMPSDIKLTNPKLGKEDKAPALKGKLGFGLLSSVNAQSVYPYP